MFSRLSCRVFETHKPLFLKYQPLAAIKTATPENTTAAGNENSPSGSSKRDLVNFPRLVRAEYPPPFRHLGIPESWFQAFYPKTGVTGPYALAFGAMVTLLSKEIVLDHYFFNVVAFFLFITVAKNKLGDQIAKFYNEAFQNAVYKIDESQIMEKKFVKEGITKLENSLYPEIMIDEIMKAKKENILLQMESTYRERLKEVYQKVKKQLDFQVEMENAERRIFQKNLGDYVLRNVFKSITPELEKSIMQTCIKNLNSLAVKN